MEDTKYIVETIDLARHYGDGEKVRALDGVSMHVHHGELVAVMGPSGSGKSTLLHLIGALDRPTSGKVIVAGQDLDKVKNLDKFRNQTVGFVFQLHNLIPTLTALENVEVPLYEQRISAKERHKRAKELLELVGLGDRAKHLPGQLSGGQRQRVAVARSLVNYPALVLADEPTGEVDSKRAAEIIEMLHKLNRELGTTFIIVTHDPAVARQTSRIIELDSGRIIREHIVGDTFDEDWKELRSSALGQALLSGSQAELAVNGLTLYEDGQLTKAGKFLKDLLENS
ncbi:MAG TPA: ABC transporter ATP-binding protein [Chloroflexi bacterium]|jgi:ABC-type lipoprotein export system ATPase subunit|nr:ABC transporter ATP-binding protein [Chloroflexota bacterium]